MIKHSQKKDQALHMTGGGGIIMSDRIVFVQRRNMFSGAFSRDKETFSEFRRKNNLQRWLKSYINFFIIQYWFPQFIRGPFSLIFTKGSIFPSSKSFRIQGLRKHRDFLLHVNYPVSIGGSDCYFCPIVRLTDITERINRRLFGRQCGRMLVSNWP